MSEIPNNTHVDDYRHLSPVCLDFMKKLLVKDPEFRMTTSQALEHPFITRQVLHK
jgi:serine/threonine protein kinase